MKRVIAIAAALYLLPCLLAAQGVPQSYGPNITLELAKKVATAAEAEALKNKWNIFIVIVNADANPVLIHRLEWCGLEASTSPRKVTRRRPPAAQQRCSRTAWRPAAWG